MPTLLKCLWLGTLLVLLWGWHGVLEEQARVRHQARLAALLSQLPAALLEPAASPWRQRLGEAQQFALQSGAPPDQLARLQQSSLGIRALSEAGRREAAQKKLVEELLPASASLTAGRPDADSRAALWLALTLLWALAGTQMTRSRPTPEAAIDASNYSQPLLRALDSLLIVIDPAGSILAVNTAACRTLGYSEAELIGLPYQTIYSQREQLLTMASRRDLEGQYRRRDGQLVPVVIACSLLSQGGHTQALVTLAQDVSEQRQTEARLESSESRLRLLLDRFLGAQEEERRGLARDLHDGMLQYLIAAQLQMQAFAPPIPEPAQKARQHLLAAVDEGRRLIQNLRPAALEELGLVETLRRQLQQAGSELNWQIHFENRLNGEKLPAALETTLYRLAQEATSNARKHARASSVRLVLERNERLVFFEFHDDGVGFDPGSERSGLGLDSMRERVELLGGRLDLESQAQSGTSLRAFLPVSPPDPYVPPSRPPECDQKPAAC